jgi:hypothetical protein
MKTYNYLFAVLACSFMMSSCSLDEYNPSAISTKEEWTTADGYEKLVNGCYYDLIRIVYGQAEDTYVICSEGGTDIWQDATDGSNGNWSKALRYTDFGASVGMFNEGYCGFYGCLSQCNAAIYYADKVQGITEDKKITLEAEARYLRAHSLFNIVEYWGGKYLPTEPLSSPITSLPNSKVNEFYKVILSDLEFAMKNLPLTQSVRGHVTRAAAYHLYAKACLTYSTYTDGLGNCDAITESESKDYLQKAKTAADYLIDHQGEFGVKLYDNINDVFDENNNKNNAEALFIICHSTVQAYNPRGNYYNRSWKHRAAYANSTTGIFLDGLKPSYETTVKGVTVPKLAKGNCYMEPSKTMLDLYGAKDGRYHAFFNDTYYVNNPNSGSNYTWSKSDAARYGLSESRVGNSAFDIPVGDTAVYISRDKYYSQAEKENIRYAIYNVDDNYKSQTQPLKFFPSLKKNDCPSLYCGTNASKPYSAADCIVYRLGETYLLSAEIDWRLGDNASAAQRVNVIRNRACIGHDHSMDVSSSDINSDFLLDEDAREMIGEWQRWETLKRFRAFENRIAKYNPQITTFQKDYYLRPIPAAEILLIDNATEYQNEGY